MADPQTVIEGTLKYRDNKKWKPRWCVIRKLSPVADCLHLQLYRDSKDRCKNGPTKASLSLEGFLGMETGFTLDKESNTMALICSEVVVVLAFDSRELLIQWQVKVRANLIEEHQFLVQIAHLPPKSKLASGPARLHLLDYTFCLTAGVPPKMLGVWPLRELRRFGVVDGKFCFEGGSRCGKGEGLHVLLTNQAKELVQAFDMASRGRLPGKMKVSLRKTVGGDGTRTCLKSKATECCGTNAVGKTALFSSESSGKPSVSCSSEGADSSTLKRDESHIRPCHMHYRWPSCIVPCGAPTRDILCDETQHKTLARSAASTHAQMFWTMGHCSGCGLHYSRRVISDKDKAQPTQDDNRGFTPQWTMDLGVVSPSKDGLNNMCARATNRNRVKAPHDRSSLCSQSSQSSGTSSGSHTSSSSSSSISEYSVPKNNCIETFYDRPKNIHHIHHNPPYNRLSATEENPLCKNEAMTPSGARSGVLGPIVESADMPPCTCWNQMMDVQPTHDIPTQGNEMGCTCWSRHKRNSVDVDMPSFSSSGSSNASPSTSPKKHPSVVGVPILLPCTCGKFNAYLNYAVPRSGAPVKDIKDKESSKHSTARNITESENNTVETKIINKMDNSSSYSLNEDNGNKSVKCSLPKVSEAMAKIPQTQPQPPFCTCQRLLFCPSGFLPTWNRSLAAAKNSLQQRNISTGTEYATVMKKADPVPESEHASVKLEEDNQARQDQNLNLFSRQRPLMCPVPLECCGGRMAIGVPMMNSWKKDNANHIYVNLKYLQEQAAAAAANRGVSEKMIPYYANLYFLQTLSLYENSGLLAVRPSTLFPCSDSASQVGGSMAHKNDEFKKVINKKRLEPPTNNAVYEMMSFNRESPTNGGENYMLMQPRIHEDELLLSETRNDTPVASQSSAATESLQQQSQETSDIEVSSLPLRPFMPVLLPFHDHVCNQKTSTEGHSSDSTKCDGAKKCISEDDGHSSTSSSLGDTKMSFLRRCRSSSSDGRQCEELKSKEDYNTIAASVGSPKSTPIRKHPILTKLTFRSKEKSFSTDEITPPSTAPPSPDSMFLESIQKYPFHRSADCLQLNEEYRLSEEDLSQDPENIMSDSLSKVRSTHSIKRSSSVPCKANPAQQQPQLATNAGDSLSQPANQAAVFSHFIAYHGSLPRRCYGNAASRHPLVERKVASFTSHESTLQQEPKPVPDASNVIYISECKQCHQLVTSPEGLLLLDAKSMTSSSSSDMSDYMESLSLCSRSSSGSSGEYIRSEELANSGGAKTGSMCTSSLRPRSGKEYHSFDRIVLQEGCTYIPVSDCAHLTLPCLRPFDQDFVPATCPGSEFASAECKKFKTTAGNRTNSPSPGYVSSSPGNADFVSPEKASQLFVFPKESKDLNYLEVVSISESEPTSPVVKGNTVQYAVIDMVATVAAEKLGLERAQLRDVASPASSHSKLPPDEKET